MSNRKFRFEENIDTATHDAFVGSHKYGHLTQASAWAKVKAGWTPHFVGVYEWSEEIVRAENLVASTLVLVRNFPLGQKLAYCPRGPVLDWNDEEVLKFTLTALKKFTKKIGAFELCIDPPVVSRQWLPNPNNIEYIPIEATATKLINNISNLGYKKTSPKNSTYQTQNTFIMESSDLYIKTISASKRRHYKTAKKIGYELEEATLEQLPALAEFIKGVGERHGNAVRDENYFRKLCDAYGDNAHLFVATLDVNKDLRDRYDKIESLKLDLESASKKRTTEIKEKIASEERTLKIFEEIKATCSYPADSPLLYNGKVIGYALLAISQGDVMYFLYGARNVHLDKFYIADFALLESTIKAKDYGCGLCDNGGTLRLEDSLSKYKLTFASYYQEYIGEFKFPAKKLVSALFNKALAMRARNVK